VWERAKEAGAVRTMIRRTVLAAVVALALTASPALAANGFEFVDWTGQGSGVVSGTLRGAGVTLTGTTQTNVLDGTWQGFDSDYFAPRLLTSDEVELRSVNGSSFTLAFASPVKDPLFHLASVASRLVFPPGTVITKVSGQDSLVVSGNLVSGTVMSPDAHGDTDSNGTIRLSGTFSSLAFTAAPTFLNGDVPDGVGIAIGVSVAGPQSLIMLDPADPGPGGAYAGSVGVRVAAIDGPGGGYVQTRCVLDPAAAPASFDHLPAGRPYLDGGSVATAGVHTVYAASRDFFGTKDGPVSRTFRVAAAPDTTITDGPTGERWEKSPLFSFASTVSGSTFECSVDLGAFTACAAPYRTLTLSSGSHSFRVRAVGPDGSRDSSPAFRSFTVAAPVSKQLSCRVQPV
jgi:type 1 fimbria pilin